MRRIVTKLVVGMAFTAVVMFGADTSLGTWKWNPATSKSTNANPLKSRIDVMEAAADGGVKRTLTEQRADGATYNYSYTFKYDGKEYPVTGAAFDTISAKRIDTNRTVTVTKKTDGSRIQTTQYVYSKDGKTRTATTKGTDSAGKPFISTYVYDKQ